MEVKVEKSLKLSVPIFSILTIMLVGAKLFAGADITWLWAVSPLWLPIAIVFGIVVLVFIYAILYVTLNAIFD